MSSPHLAEVSGVATVFLEKLEIMLVFGQHRELVVLKFLIHYPILQMILTNYLFLKMKVKVFAV